MSSKAKGQAAIDGLNGKELKGRTLNVNEARPCTKDVEDISTTSTPVGNLLYPGR